MKKFLVILVTVAAVGVFTYTLARSTLFSPTGEVNQNPSNVATVVENSNSSTQTPVSPSEYPYRLIIPSVGVNAGVQRVGVKANGEMANPSNFTDVAWYKLGTLPGKDGSAVIAGHVDNALALNGVFKHLIDIKVGDDVYVTRNDGTKLHFQVADVKSYPYNNAPSQQIFGLDDGSARLNLVTCSGVWLKDKRTYSERLVVYTKLVS